MGIAERYEREFYLVNGGKVSTDASVQYGDYLEILFRNEHVYDVDKTPRYIKVAYELHCLAQWTGYYGAVIKYDLKTRTYRVSFSSSITVCEDVTTDAWGGRLNKAGLKDCARVVQRFLQETRPDALETLNGHINKMLKRAMVAA